MNDQKKTPADERDAPGSLVPAVARAWLEKVLPDQDSRRQALVLWDRLADYLKSHADELRTFDVISRDGQAHQIVPRLWMLPDEKMLPAFEDRTLLQKADQNRAELEKQLKDSRDMETIGRLAGGMVHEFNNILTGILGYAEMIKMSIEPSDLVYSEADEIRKACKHASDLIDYLLAFTRKQTIAPRIVQVDDMILHAQKMLKRLIREESELQFNPAGGLWNIKIDPGQLEQILIHLAIQVCRSAPHAKTLVIATHNVTFPETPALASGSGRTGDFVLIGISASGSGMSEEEQPENFHPFSSFREPGAGIGSGLSAVADMVRQNRGFMNLFSEEGKALSFRIYFPRILNKNGKALENIRTEWPIGHENILLVEDERIVRKTVRDILEKQGYTVLAAENGLEALRASNQYQGDLQLLLSDVIMPNMNGHELYQQLKTGRPDLKALFMSGYTEKLIAKQGILGQGTHFIQKPFSMESLSRKVRDVLDQ